LYTCNTIRSFVQKKVNSKVNHPNPHNSSVHLDLQGRVDLIVSPGMQTHTIHHPYSVPKGISSRPTHLGVRNGLFGSARGHENSGRPFASGGVPSGGTQKKIRHANKISHSHLPPSPIPCRPSPSPGGRRQAPPFPLLRPLPFSFTSLRPSLSPRSVRAALPWCWQKGIRVSSGRMGSGRRGSGRRGPGRAMAS
jgi:hypothetical protein